MLAPRHNFLKPDEVGFILNDGGIKVLICDEELSVYAEALRGQRPGLRLLPVEDFASLPAAVPTAPLRQQDDLAVIIYTSGTTGRPKGDAVVREPAAQRR